MMADFDSFAFNLQVFAGVLQNLMDEDLREWENRERTKDAGLPTHFGKWIESEDA